MGTNNNQERNPAPLSMIGYGNQQQSGTQSNPTKNDSYGNQQQSGTQSNPTKHDNYGKHQQSGTQDNSHHSGKHTHDKARTNQETNQLNQCTNGASCWNYAQNILCVHSTCIFGSCDAISNA